MLGKSEGRKRETEDEMVGWHHRLDGHESEPAPGDSEGQKSLVCCSSWGCKESNTTLLLKNTINDRDSRRHVTCVWGAGVTTKGYRVTFGTSVLKLDSVNILKTMKVATFYRRVLWYVN